MERTIPIDPILEKGYNVRLLVDDFDGLIEKWSNWSEDFRSNADSSLNCQYGKGEKDKLDIFRCGNRNAPLFIFIHGGYYSNHTSFKHIHKFTLCCGTWPYVQDGINQYCKRYSEKDSPNTPNRPKEQYRQ